MKILELREKLNKKGVPSDMYSLDGWTPFEKCVLKKGEGNGMFTLVKKAPNKG